MLGKKTKILAVSALLALSFSTAVLAEGEVYVTVDGQRIEFDVKPTIMDGRTMVPVRAIFEAVGADVQWDEKTQTVTGTKDDTVVQMTIGSNKLYINGASILMDCVPVKIDNRVLTPARYVVESYGYVVTWDEVGNTVEIMSMDAYQDSISNIDDEEEDVGFFAGVANWFKGLFS